MKREKGYLSRERREWAEWARGWGSLAVAPFASGFSISAEHKGGRLPCSQTLLPAPRGHLGAATLGKFSQLVPSSYHTQALEQGPRYPKTGHPDTVHMNPRPFCTWARACLSLSFWRDISNYESHTTVKTRGRLCNGPAAQPPTPTVWGQDFSSQRGGKTLCPFPWEQMRQLPMGFSVRTSEATDSREAAQMSAKPVTKLREGPKLPSWVVSCSPQKRLARWTLSWFHTLVFSPHLTASRGGALYGLSRYCSHALEVLR